MGKITMVPDENEQAKAEAIAEEIRSLDTSTEKGGEKYADLVKELDEMGWHYLGPISDWERENE